MQLMPMAGGSVGTARRGTPDCAGAARESEITAVRGVRLVDVATEASARPRAKTDYARCRRRTHDLTHVCEPPIVPLGVNDSCGICPADNVRFCAPPALPSTVPSKLPPAARSSSY